MVREHNRTCGAADARRLRLLRLAPVIPAQSRTISELREPLALSDTDVAVLTRLQGMRRVAVAADLDMLDLLACAGEAALEDRGSVRYLIHAHTTGYLRGPGAHWIDELRTRLRLDRARSFTISQQGCVNGITALRLAERLLRAEPAGSTALLLVGEKAPSWVQRYLPGVSVMGDAVAGVLVGLDGAGDVVLGSAHRTRGEYYESLGMTPEREREYRQVFRSEMVAVTSEALKDAGVGLSDVDLVLPHNINRYAWTTVARDLGIPLDRIYLENVARLGHCFGADPFVNLATARAEQVLGPGQTALAASAGQGGTFAAAVFAIAGKD